MAEVSITDIARVAGVSPSTVSRALANHPRISPERCASIQALALEMGYRPSQVARSLVTGKTRTLGVVATDVTDPFVAEVMKGAEAAGREAGYGLLFAMSNQDPEQEILSGADAVGPAGRWDDRDLEPGRGSYGELLGDNRSVPLVLVNYVLPGSLAYSVRMNNVAGARDAVAYLRRLGHRRIGFIGGPAGGRSSRERLEGYRLGVTAGGQEYRDELVVPGSGQLEDGPRAWKRFSSCPICLRPSSATTTWWPLGCYRLP